MTDDIHAAAASYVVGGLPPDELQAYETHLAGCADCQAEVAELEETTLVLSEAVATEPPPQLRDSVMAAIASTPQESPSVEPSNVVPLRRSSGNRAIALVAAAAVVVAVGFGGWALQSRNSARDDAQLAQAQAAQLAEVVAAPDSQSASAEVSGGGSATVVRSQSQGVALLVAADLPALPDGKTYEAWTIDGAPAPAGTFESGGSHTTLELTPAAVDTSTVAVTVEPAGGSDQPTTDPIVAIDLT